MKNFRPLPLFALFLLIFSSCAKQRPLDPAEVFSELAQKAQNVDSYRVDTKTLTSMGGQEITITGKMAYKKPGFMHMTTTTNMMGEMTHEIFRSDNVMWTYMPSMKVATKIEMPKMPPEMGGQRNPGEIDPIGMITSFPKEAVSSVNKKVVDGYEVFELQIAPEHFRKGIPSAQADVPMAPLRMEYLMYADSGLLYKMLMYGKDGALMMEQAYTNYEVNIPIPDSEFQFTPPEGVQVMDMSQAAGNMMNQMKKMQKHPPAPME